MSPEYELNGWSAERQAKLDKKKSLNKILKDEELSCQDKIRSICKKEKGIDFQELADILDISNNHLTSEIEDLKKQGFNFHITELGNIHQITHPQESSVIFDDSKLFKGRTFRFGYVSDTQFGSKKATPQELEATYEWFKREEIKIVYHTGDITDGRDVYRGQDRELKYWGQDDQVNYVIRKYPKKEGIITKFITGNHDLSLYQKEGAPDPGVAIAKERPDLKYLGQIKADIRLPNDARMRLLHPEGGGAYAVSYLAQKYINALEGGDKPNILLLGHWHTRNSDNYRNVDYVQGACFQHQTLYLLRKGIMPVRGGWIIEINVSPEGSVNKFKQEFFKFF